MSAIFRRLKAVACFTFAIIYYFYYIIFLYYNNKLLQHQAKIMASIFSIYNITTKCWNCSNDYLHVVQYSNCTHLPVWLSVTVSAALRRGHVDKWQIRSFHNIFSAVEDYVVFEFVVASDSSLQIVPRFCGKFVCEIIERILICQQKVVDEGKRERGWEGLWSPEMLLTHWQ